MEITYHQDPKLVEVWLTRADLQDAEVDIRLTALYRECKASGHQVVVFKSGTESLSDITSDLLRYNRRRLAAQEAAPPHQQSS